MDRTPLDLATLSPAAQRALGPGPGRTMAARGLMPLPPADQLAVLYQLSLDPEVGTAARLTAAGLPERVVAGTLGDAALDPRVLDFFAEGAAEKPSVLDAILRNPSVADATLALLAGRVDSRGADLIAQNEQRLLRHPEIIGAMYGNRRARMSTVDRAVELAVRNHVRVPGVAAWDEVTRAILGDSGARANDDAVFAQLADAYAADEDLPETPEPEPEDDADEAPPEPKEDGREAPLSSLSVPAKLRLAQIGNAFARSKLVRDPVRLVAMAAIKSPSIKESEVREYARNPSLSEDVIRYIVGRQEWTKSYSVKLSLCRNPKAPISETIKFLPFLRAKDLQQVSKSKGVPSALVAQARKLVMQRGGNK
ncbi:MAG TPA: hypothetical protein VGM88_22470 [Kofleriaceae bacterium]|jgi:hypothetical protein